MKLNEKEKINGIYHLSIPSEERTIVTTMLKEGLKVN
jgi:hypothetical protein